MKIVELHIDDFNKFEKTFPHRNFYQTIEYGSLMDRHQFDDYYLGLIDESNNIHAATLILVNKVFIGYKWGYCPRGFLIDYNNVELLKAFTNEIVSYNINYMCCICTFFFLVQTFNISLKKNVPYLK